MLKFIIGTIGDMDTPMNPAAKGVRSFGAYISNVTIEDYQRERDEVLGATPEKIRELAPIVEAGLKQNHLCVVGNYKNIMMSHLCLMRLSHYLYQQYKITVKKNDFLEWRKV